MARMLGKVRALQAYARYTSFMKRVVRYIRENQTEPGQAPFTFFDMQQ